MKRALTNNSDFGDLPSQQFTFTTTSTSIMTSTATSVSANEHKGEPSTVLRAARSQFWRMPPPPIAPMATSRTTSIALGKEMSAVLNDSRLNHKEKRRKLLELAEEEEERNSTLDQSKDQLKNNEHESDEVGLEVRGMNIN
jgi:hypothetical protein